MDKTYRELAGPFAYRSNAVDTATMKQKQGYTVRIKKARGGYVVVGYYNEKKG